MELLVVLAVLGILSVLIFPLAEVNAQRDKETELKRALWEIRDAIDAYKKAQDDGRFAVGATVSGYPPSLESLVQGVPDKKAGGQTVFFLRRIPRDPFADAALPAMKTWGLRSYASSADQPSPGNDVYDIYSRSDRLALNGTRLRDW